MLLFLCYDNHRFRRCVCRRVGGDGVIKRGLCYRALELLHKAYHLRCDHVSRSESERQTIECADKVCNRWCHSDQTLLCSTNIYEQKETIAQNKHRTMKI